MEVYDTNHGYVGKKIAEFDKENGSKFYVLNNNDYPPGIIGFFARKTTLLSDTDVRDLFKRDLAAERRHYESLANLPGVVYSYCLGLKLGVKVSEFSYRGKTVGVFDTYAYENVELYAPILWQEVMSGVELIDRDSIVEIGKRKLERILDKYEYLGVDVSKERTELEDSSVVYYSEESYVRAYIKLSEEEKVAVKNLHDSYMQWVRRLGSEEHADAIIDELHVEICTALKLDLNNSLRQILMKVCF